MNLKNRRATMTTYSKGSLYAADPNSTVVHYVLQDGYCNTRCKHCYMLSQNQTRRKRDFETAKEDIRGLLSQGYKLDFRGTETLLDPAFLELFPLVGQTYLQTNGIELIKNPSLFKILKQAGITTIMFTYPSEPASLVGFQTKTVEEIVVSAKDNSFRTVLDYIVTSEVVASFKRDVKFFENLADHLISFGADELRLVRLIPLANEMKALTPSVKDMENIAMESVRLESAYGNKLDITRAGQFGLYDLRRSLKEKFLGIKVPAPEESGIMDCPAGKKLFVIDVDNNIYPCLYLMNKDFKMGEFRNGVIRVKRPEIIPGGVHLADCPAATIQNERMKLCAH